MVPTANDPNMLGKFKMLFRHLEHPSLSIISYFIDIQEKSEEDEGNEEE